jgi:hypothetical protein
VFDFLLYYYCFINFEILQKEIDDLACQLSTLKGTNVKLANEIDKELERERIARGRVFF